MKSTVAVKALTNSRRKKTKDINDLFGSFLESFFKKTDKDSVEYKNPIRTITQIKRFEQIITILKKISTNKSNI